MEFKAKTPYRIIKHSVSNRSEYFTIEQKVKTFLSGEKWKPVTKHVRFVGDVILTFKTLSDAMMHVDKNNTSTFHYKEIVRTGNHD